MVDKKITLKFEVERGDPINQYHFSARMKLTNESKKLLREKLGDSIEFNNLDNYFDLDHKNFYIHHNKYLDNDVMYVKDNEGKPLTSYFQLNRNEFSVELDGSEIGDYGFYYLGTIYSKNDYESYERTKEKVYDDHGQFRSNTVEILDNLLSNTGNLTVQEIFSQLQNEITEQEMRTAREKRESEEELNRKNEELKGLIDKDEISLFKVIKGEDIDGKRSTAVLKLDDREITLDSDRFYIAKYGNNELLYCVQLGDDTLLSYKDLFFVLSTYADLKSGFYSITDHNSYGSSLRSGRQYFSDNKLFEELLGKDDISLLNINEQQARQKRTIEAEYLIDEGESLNVQAISSTDKKQADSEGNNWNILDFIKNVVSGFFSKISNWWTTETQIDQQVIDAEFSNVDQGTILKIEESYSKNDSDLI